MVGLLDQGGQAKLAGSIAYSGSSQEDRGVSSEMTGRVGKNNLSSQERKQN